MAITTVQTIINGQTYDLTLNSTTGRYEATISAPSKSSFSQEDHKYGVTVTATDDAGNVTTVDRTHATLGSSLQLRVLEKVAPVIASVYPTAGARIISNKPTIQFNVTDNDSGVNTASLALKVNGTAVAVSALTITAITNGYNIKYTPATALAEGSNSVSLDCADNDGNAATQVSVSFTVDTVAPSLVITAPTEGFITNVAALTVRGTTNDDTSSPCVVTIKLNNVDQGSVTIGTGGTFSKAITLADGANTIVVTSTDQAGKSTSITRHVVLDTAAPVFRSVTITPNPVDAGKTYIISVEVEDV